jgi:hypothetical protein
LTPDTSDGIVDFVNEFGVKMANLVNPAEMIIDKMKYLFICPCADHKIAIIANSSAAHLPIFISGHWFLPL